MGSFEIKDSFYLDGRPFKIISGSIHYFRIMPQYWRDRLEKLRDLGANTVETYVAWNMHEPERGKFCFEGLCDIEGFIEIAQELGLYVIIRPSPYICAEWEFGGLPGWLLAEENMNLRAYDDKFLQYVREYYEVLLPRLVPHQITKGGNIIMMQVENEYGHYGNDGNYLRTLRDMMKDGGVEVPLITSDDGCDEAIMGGSIEDVLPTANFGSQTKKRFGVLKKHVNGGPLMCTEFWVGWFDSWNNGGHIKGNLEQACAELDEILSVGSVNIYMFIGGTNFGFMNGSNYYDKLEADVTSYDYDALLTEAGDVTIKYKRFKEIIARHTRNGNADILYSENKKAYGHIGLKESVGLFRVADDFAPAVSSACPKSMERLGQNYGYILYESELTNEQRLERIRLWRANDRANVFVEGDHLLTLDEKALQKEHRVDRDIKQGEHIRILVENMGRVNFGPRMEEQRKGIDGGVQINGHLHNNWKQYCLPLGNIDMSGEARCRTNDLLTGLDYSRGRDSGEPAIYHFELEADVTADTFLDMEGWGKGCVIVNGFNVGRFWEKGPQKRLYIPAPLLKQGKNDIVVFETEGVCTDSLSFYDEPDLG